MLTWPRTAAPRVFCKPTNDTEKKKKNPGREKKKRDSAVQFLGPHFGTRLHLTDTTGTNFRVHFLTPKTGPADDRTIGGRTKKWSRKLRHGVAFFFSVGSPRARQVTTLFVWCNWLVACVPRGETAVFVNMDENCGSCDRTRANCKCTGMLIWAVPVGVIVCACVCMCEIMGCACAK